MKACFKQLQFRPSSIGQNVKEESSCHKAKVVGWSAFMVFTSGLYLSYFSDVTSRANQLQNLALAGRLQFNEYVPHNEKQQFAYDVLIDLYEEKSAKDLKYIQMGWKSQIDSETNTAVGPQGPADDQDWYTQTQRFTDYKEVDTTPLTPEQAAQAQIDADAKKYKEWETMHSSSVVWYDTAACDLSNELRSQYGIIGDANFLVYKATAPQFNQPANAGSYLGLNWWTGNKENPEPEASNYSTDVEAVNPYHQLGPIPAELNLADDFALMKRNLKHLQSMKDCDMDCQAKGSQLSLVAALNIASLTLIFLNGLLGIWGGWSVLGRVAQAYFNIFTCLFQLAILIACGTMIFTPYAMQCYGSLFPTAGGFSDRAAGFDLWTMHDDYVMIITLWATQFIWLFIFFFIGMCGAYREPEKQATNKTQPVSHPATV